MDKKEFAAIMDAAIAAEVESYEFYRDVAAKVTDAGLKKIFQDCADEEKGHKIALETIKLKDVETFSFKVGADYNIAATIELPRLSLDMKPADAVALAMKKEEEAMKMYSCLAECTDDTAVKKVYTELAKMEEGHKEKMEGIYTATAFPEVW
ncbi:MAG: ferritin family protein [Firmicutes bacterium]|nr:ferritin family protein [Bacillota bacterium]